MDAKPAPATNIFWVRDTHEEPPCELPTWCSAPDEGLKDAAIEIWRLPVTSPGVEPQPERLVLGRRAWVHFARRHALGAEGGSQPDIELKTPRASRKQALVLRNWHGQVFLMDIGSTHGTFLGRHRLPSKTPREWRPGVVAFFADKTAETFELRADNLRKSQMPSFSAHAYAAAVAIMQSATLYTGPTRMMQTEAGEQLNVQPLRQMTEPLQGCAGSPAQSNNPLYPGSWQTSTHGFRGEQLQKVVVQTAVQTSDEKPTSNPSETKTGFGEGESEDELVFLGEFYSPTKAKQNNVGPRWENKWKRRPHCQADTDDEERRRRRTQKHNDNETENKKHERKQRETESGELRDLEQWRFHVRETQEANERQKEGDACRSKERHQEQEETSEKKGQQGKEKNANEDQMHKNELRTVQKMPEKGMRENDESRLKEREDRLEKLLHEERERQRRRVEATQEKQNQTQKDCPMETEISIRVKTADSGTRPTMELHEATQERNKDCTVGEVMRRQAREQAKAADGGNKQTKHGKLDVDLAHVARQGAEMNAGSETLVVAEHNRIRTLEERKRQLANDTNWELETFGGQEKNEQCRIVMNQHENAANSSSSLERSQRGNVSHGSVRRPCRQNVKQAKRIKNKPKAKSCRNLSSRSHSTSSPSAKSAKNQRRQIHSKKSAKNKKLKRNRKSSREHSHSSRDDADSGRKSSKGENKRHHNQRSTSRKRKRRNSRDARRSERSDRQRKRSEENKSHKERGKHMLQGDPKLQIADEERSAIIDKYAAMSENDLMKLGPTRLVECFKMLITNQRLREPDFDSGRLRDAYNDALTQLM